ncbi:hypothetical protein BGX34_010790 [Mortierella sp. NVP85]|nr:hypothetical protein BGX34_010790 [Mortierella sp. NVP85]
MSNTTRRRSDFYPRYIYYCASNDEVAQFRAKCSMVGGTHDTLTSAVNTLMESLKIEQDSRVANYKELKQEINASGEDQEIERARSHEKLKQEMDELKATINRLLLALDSQNIPPHRPDSGEAS